jgi:hypothetical protein
VKIADPQVLMTISLTHATVPIPSANVLVVARTEAESDRFSSLALTRSLRL